MAEDLVTKFMELSISAKKRKYEVLESPDVFTAYALVKSQILNISKNNPALSPNIGFTWFQALSNEFSEEYFKELGEFLQIERRMYSVYPPEKDVYFWTNTVKIQNVKVIILGQEPYHGPNEAHGLAYSVSKGVQFPPSLQNIFQELCHDIKGFKYPSHGHLYGWSSQVTKTLKGVLLLNMTLTVRSGCPDSHKGKWSTLTDAVIKWINDNLPNSVFMLWGEESQNKIPLITKSNHLVLTAAHPSSWTDNSFGCRHFSKANEYLIKNKKIPIAWNYLP